jgi:hypothetical protein
LIGYAATREEEDYKETSISGNIAGYSGIIVLYFYLCTTFPDFLSLYDTSWKIKLEWFEQDLDQSLKNRDVRSWIR